MHQQAYDKLQKMQAFGDSKRLDKLENPEDFARKIYSFSTYQTYFKHIKYFIKWIQKEHPEIKTLKKAEKFVPEWLQTRVDKGLSAWTIQTEEAALNKLYQIKLDDENRFQPPRRLKENIVRSRGTKKRDAHFSEVNFVCHTITLILQGTLFTGSMLKDKMLFEQMQNRLIY